MALYDTALFTPSIWAIRFCVLYATRVVDCAMDTTVCIFSLHRLDFSEGVWDGWKPRLDLPTDRHFGVGI